MFPFKREVYTYYTDMYTIEECRNLLEKALESEDFCSDGLHGSINSQNDTFWLLHKYEMERSLARIYNGRLLSCDHGTIIRGSFETNSAVVVFLFIWVYVLLNVTLFTLISGCIVFLEATLFSIILPLLALPSFFISAKTGKSHEEYVLTFIERTFFTQKLP